MNGLLVSGVLITIIGAQITYMIRGMYDCVGVGG